MIPSSDDVLNFWFKEIEWKQWYVKDPKFDEEIRTRFGAVHELAINGALPDSWNHDTALLKEEEAAKKILAQIILLDQFSRNLFRDTPRAFAYDEMALKLSKEAVAKGYDKTLDTVCLQILYIPFMHSECKQDHEEAVKLYSSKKGLELSLEFEMKHKVIIDRFGRYPHRNEVLGRESTSEEIEFLKEEGSSF
eukprot:CAMPEP_0178965424 /NCGR_PEP_ID=MMETSP0789-20121207/16278_1 /TAXON_ID=3005 /ORGANISM="Rhizosolenia setigera, Strain CCMP 1694" /LENGTH=192 /DNA_ID=CAMNT_0020650415 /DNA_START=200 /DNA_END=778 /DNA_ORIENTATION=-